MGRLLRALKSLWTTCNEVALNIDTHSNRPGTSPVSDSFRPWWFGPQSERAVHRDNYDYASPDYWYLRKVIRILKLRPEDVVYDIGAGKGRFLCMAARQQVRKCVGVELSDSLCAAARDNASRLRGRCAPIEIVCEDACAAPLSDGTVYFLFNPFGPDTMRVTLANIERSLSGNPRDIVIVYYNPTHASVFESCGWLHMAYEFRTRGELRVTFWSNCRPETSHRLLGIR